MTAALNSLVRYFLEMRKEEMNASAIARRIAASPSNRRIVRKMKTSVRVVSDRSVGSLIVIRDPRPIAASDRSRNGTPSVEGERRTAAWTARELATAMMSAMYRLAERVRSFCTTA